MKSEELKIKNFWRIGYVGRFFILIFSFLILLAGCSRDKACDTPFGEGASIDIYMPDFAALQNVGGTVTVNRGYKGIFVRRISYAEFVAFECACPHCHDVGLRPLEGWDGDVLKCPDCGSMYETVNGQPLEGAASGCPLYEYNTHFDGYILNIY